MTGLGLRLYQHGGKDSGIRMVLKNYCALGSRRVDMQLVLDKARYDILIHQVAE